MARIRTIKPEFFSHWDLYQAEIDTDLPLRVAFAGLWTLADREGLFKWIPQQLKLGTLPYDEVDFSRVLDALVTRGFLQKYSESGVNYGSIVSFTDHQVINNRESASILPKPNDSNIIKKEPDACTTREVHALGEGKGKEGKGRERKGKERKEKSLVELQATSTANTSVSELFDFWRYTMKHAKAQLDKSRRKLIGDALKMGYSVVDLKLAIAGCSMCEWHMGKNDRSTRYDALHTILKSADKIDKFIGIHNQGGAKAGRGAELDNISNQAIQEWLGESNVIDISEVQHG